MGTNRRLGLFSAPGRRERAIAMEALEELGIADYAHRSFAELSGGEQQLVLAARALAQQARLLLMDEPYGQLDIELRFKLEDELVKLWEMTGTTVIFITHNIEEAVYLGQRIMILTNKPTTVKETVDNNMPRPRDIAAPEFIDLRNRVTERIKWW